MELIQGADLSRSGPMAWPDACRCLRDVASVLGLLHARCLVHRDPSPRNLLWSGSGRLKLIDFGALASFGPSREVVGTPPFVAPEALQSLPLNQRTDVFGLGALAYWLLTGAHAFPTNQLGDLPRLWQQEPRPASSMLALLGSKVLPPIPPALDELLSSMLRIAPEERMNSCAGVIDRLNAIASLEPESETSALQGYLTSSAFVGRQSEREGRHVTRPSATRRRSHTARGGRARDWTLALPERAWRAVLGRRCPRGERSRDRGATALRRRRVDPPGAPACSSEQHRRGDGRARCVAGLSLCRGARAPPRFQANAFGVDRRSWPRAGRAARGRVRGGARASHGVIVDDLQAADEESLALLTALAHSDGDHKLLLVLAFRADQLGERAHTLSKLSSRASRMRLGPLSREHLFELLRSVFGPARYLERLSERLYGVSGGNPAHCLEVAQYLVLIGEARVPKASGSYPPSYRPRICPRAGTKCTSARSLI